MAALTGTASTVTSTGRFSVLFIFYQAADDQHDHHQQNSAYYNRSHTIPSFT
jgi:hypothetical protein